MRRRSARIGAALLAVALAGCGGDARLSLEGPPPTTVAPAEAPSFPDCTAAEAAQRPDHTASYTPISPMPRPGSMPAGSTMAAIQQRGRLIVGVSFDTLLFGSRNPLTGAIEGFDIDMLKEVAAAIFGPGRDDAIEYRVITYAERLPKLIDGEVDLVAHTMTINCRRWKQINFSSTYFDAGQTVLVRTSSPFDSVGDLTAAKARVCAPEGSTNIDEIRRPAYAGIQVIGKPDISDCLVAMQQGSVDAVTGDDTVLAGFAVQDPTTRVVSARPFTSEPYGLGIAKAEIDLVRFVNGVIEQVRSSGRWAEIYRRWLIDTNALSGPVPSPPPAVYGRG